MEDKKGWHCSGKVRTRFRLPRNTDAEYRNLPDPILELTSNQLALLRRGYSTFYDFPQTIIIEIANTIGVDKVGDKVGALIFNKNTKTTMKISLASCTLRIHMSNY